MAYYGKNHSSRSSSVTPASKQVNVRSVRQPTPNTLVPENMQVKPVSKNTYSRPLSHGSNFITKWAQQNNVAPQNLQEMLKNPAFAQAYAERERSVNPFTDPIGTTKSLIKDSVGSIKSAAPAAAAIAAMIYGGSALTNAMAGGTAAGGAAAGSGAGAAGGAAGSPGLWGNGLLTMNAPAGGALGAASPAGVGTVAGGATGSLVGNGLLTMNAPAGGALGTASPTGVGTVAGAGAVPAAASALPGSTSSNNVNGGNALSDSNWWDNALIAGGSLASGYLSNQATQEGIDEIARQYDQTRADMAPWRDAGVQGLNAYQNRLNAPVPEFGFNLEDDPVYQFQLDQAQQATERAMGARGYNDSGNILLELQRNAIGETGRYGNEAYKRQIGQSQTNYGRNLDRTNQYGNLAGIGQTSTNALAGIGQNSANNLSNLYLQQGAGLNNAIQGGISNYLTNNYLQRGY